MNIGKPVEDVGKKKLDDVSGYLLIGEIVSAIVLPVAGPRLGYGTMFPIT